MKIKFFLPLLFAFIMMGSVDVMAQSADDICGFWTTEGGKSIVKIYKKSDGKYYAMIMWLKEPTYDDGTKKRDKENPDASLRDRPVVGLEIMKGFEWDGDDKEWNGDHLYDPESGNTYKGTMTLNEDDHDVMDLRGYVGITLIGRTSVWVRKVK
jgi:uncharacterized protein (DUF2147 family)